MKQIATGVLSLLALAAFALPEPFSVEKNGVVKVDGVPLQLIRFQLRNLLLQLCIIQHAFVKLINKMVKVFFQCHPFNRLIDVFRRIDIPILLFILDAGKTHRPDIIQL